MTHCVPWLIVCHDMDAWNNSVMCDMTHLYVCDNEVPASSNLLGPFVCAHSTHCYVQHSRCVCVCLIHTHCNILGVYVRIRPIVRHSRCVCVSHTYALQHSRCACAHSPNCYVRHSRCVCVSYTYALQHSRCVCAHDALLCATWPIHMCDMPHSYVWRDLFARATWPIYLRDMTDLYVRQDLLMCATCLIHICDMTHSHMRHDPFICKTWLIYMCDMSHSYTLPHSECVRTTLLIYSWNNSRCVFLWKHSRCASVNNTCLQRDSRCLCATWLVHNAIF